MLKILVKLEYALIIASCVGLAGLMVVQVLLRYVFLSPFLGIEEVAVLLGLWVYFLGLVYVTRTRGHISSGVLQLFIERAILLKLLEAVKLLLCIISSCIFLYFSINYVLQTFESGRSSTYLSWPMTIWVASMVFGFSLSLLLFFVHFYRLITGWNGPWEDGLEEIENTTR